MSNATSENRMIEDHAGVCARFQTLFPNGWGVACAAVDNHDGCCAWLANGGDVNLADSEGNTCLHHAIYNGNERLASAILDAGFSAFEQQGGPSLSDHRRSGHYRDTPETPYQLACSLGLTALAERLAPHSQSAYRMHGGWRSRRMPEEPPALPESVDPSGFLQGDDTYVDQPELEQLDKLAGQITRAENDSQTGK